MVRADRAEDLLSPPSDALEPFKVNQSAMVLIDGLTAVFSSQG